jgi:hypothetical protein
MPAADRRWEMVLSIGGSSNGTVGALYLNKTLKNTLPDSRLADTHRACMGNSQNVTDVFGIKLVGIQRRKHLGFLVRQLGVGGNPANYLK